MVGAARTTGRSECIQWTLKFGDKWTRPVVARAIVVVVQNQNADVLPGCRLFEVIDGLNDDVCSSIGSEYPA
jgi:hypothetical protein